MTTPAAARLYEAQHLMEMEGERNAIFNPKGKSIEELPVIYGFNNGGSPGWYTAYAIAQDGHVLGQHVCSSEVYMPHDLGIFDNTRPDRHSDQYQPHYPDGYRMEFVPGDRYDSHEGLKEALRLNKVLGELVEMGE